jgi:hypothetical protein
MKGGLAQGPGGLNLTVPIPGGLGRAATIDWSAERFLGAIPMVHLSQAPLPADALLVGFANVPEKHSASMAGRLYDAVMQERCG